MDDNTRPHGAHYCKTIQAARGHEMQRFYAARLEHEHPRCAIKIYIRLTNGLFSNNEYSSGDDHVTDFSGLPIVSLLGEVLNYKTSYTP
jgi:hypothetical protein